MSINPPLFILLTSVASYCIMALIYPDLLMKHNLSFLWQNDAGVVMYSIFTITSNLYHGGIQLWNSFDQMNYAYNQLSHGVYTLTNILTAFTYIILSPLMGDEAKAFHTLYSTAFQFFLILIRTTGGYLLLKKCRCHPAVIFLSLVLLNTFLSSHMYAGYSTANLYSYFFLLAYFILRFFDNFELDDFLKAILVMAVASANSMLLALGYFYLVVHFLIISCILTRISRLKLLFSRIRTGFTQKNLLKILGVLGICILLILPSGYWAKSLKQDFYIANSGLGETQGRMKVSLNPLEYFNTTSKSFARPSAWPMKVLNFKDNDWANSWLFLGISVFFLSLLGLVLSKHQEKHIFLWTIIAVFFVNFPLDPHSFLSVGHWVNALTNPFHFLLRSFHMSALLSPFLFLPLTAFGLQSLKELMEGKSTSTYEKRVPWAMLFVMGAMILFACEFPLMARMYGILGGIIVLGILWLVQRTGLAHSVVWVIFSILLLVDFQALSIYMNDHFYRRHQLKPVNWIGVDYPQPLIIDYQNPRLMPFREYYSFHKKDLEPFSTLGMQCLFLKPVDNQLMAGGLLVGNVGLFFEHTPLERYVRGFSIYSPFHRSYKDIAEDSDLEEYLSRDQRLIYLAYYALEAKEGTLGEILKRNWDRDVVLVESKGQEFPRHLNNLNSFKPENTKEPMRFLEFSFSFKEAKMLSKGEFKEYIFSLPKSFPDYLSTTVFTKDRLSWQLKVGARELLPVQGSLIDGFSFDVQNLRHRKLSILLPKDFNVADVRANLQVKLPEQVQDIWRNEYDNFGFTYRAAHDGWLVMHQPFDQKWRLSVDGKDSPVYKVNNHFIGTPIIQGDHKILLQYWPNTFLRVAIFISMILTIAVFFGLVASGIRLEKSYG